MNLKIQNRNDFVTSFLDPISKISEKCVIKVGKTNLSSLAATPDGSLILYSKYKHKGDVSDDASLNIVCVNKFLKICSYVDKPDLNLQIDHDKVLYEDEEVQFNYYLVEDGVISTPAVSVEKLRKVKYNTSFTIPSSVFNDLNKLSLYANDSEKVYFWTEDGIVFAELNDRKRPNLNNVRIKVCETYKGDGISTPIPIRYENIRIISASQRDEINMFINTELSVVLFQHSDENTNAAYFVSGMVG